MSTRGVWFSVSALIAIVSILDLRAWAFNADISANGCSMAFGGDLTQSEAGIVCGIPRNVYENLIIRHENSRSERAEAIGLLSEKLRLSERQIEAVFEAARREGVPPERMGEALLQIAERYKNLLEGLQDNVGDSREIRQKKVLATKALEESDLERVNVLLDQIVTLEDGRPDQQAPVAAETIAKKAEVALLRMRYRDAADLYASAAAHVAKKFSSKKNEYLRLQAKALLVDGKDFGRAESLSKATEIYQKLLSEVVRSEEPVVWAQIQSDLGNALAILGSREPGTSRLEEAVIAYRAALEERTRDRSPFDWAMTQTNLGVALQELGRREPGTARLKEAVATHRAALEEWSRERVPLEWATTQNSLGAALADLGSRELVRARLETAVAAYRAALEVLTLDSVPFNWASTQFNLGNALQELGTRELGTARLQEAVAAYREALLVWTRDGVPRKWAMTQNNLGNALAVLGERELGTSRLKEAVSAYRAALEERPRDRLPLHWAMTQNNLGNALQVLGTREHSKARLEEAVAAHQGALEEWTLESIALEWERKRNITGAALKEVKHDRVPLNWAWMHYDTGTELTVLSAADVEPSITESGGGQKSSHGFALRGLRASRLFAPIKGLQMDDYAGVGVVAFPRAPYGSLAARATMLCEAFSQAMETFELETQHGFGLDRQVVTIWPLEPKAVDTGTEDDGFIGSEPSLKSFMDVFVGVEKAKPLPDIACEEAIERYDWREGSDALQQAADYYRSRGKADVAERVGAPDQDGPWLLAWAPGKNKGSSADDVLVLAYDLSEIRTQQQAERVFQSWRITIERNADLWLVPQVANEHWTSAFVRFLNMLGDNTDFYTWMIKG